MTFFSNGRYEDDQLKSTAVSYSWPLLVQHQRREYCSTRYKITNQSVVLTGKLTSELNNNYVRILGHVTIT